MNNDKHNLDLEGLLAEVEHAGRDARRQEELGAMIDSMADTKSHGFWWWTVRVAAAACVLFFIGTAVRIWFIPTSTDVPMVAEADVPAIVPPVTVDSTVAIPVAPSPTVRRVRLAPAAVAEEAVPETDLFAEDVATEPAEVLEPTPCEQDDTVAFSSPLATLGATSPSLGEDQDGVERLEPMVVDVQVAEPAKKAQPRHRESIFKSLFRRDDISKMDGTMLAISLL